MPLPFVRHSNRPLKALVAAVEAFGRDQKPPQLPESGPLEIRSLTRAFEGMARDIGRANQDRELLLAGISHDLRSPMARMAVALEMASDLPQDLKRSMEEDLRDMDKIVEQFLAYVRSSGEEEAEELEVAALVREVAERARRSCDAASEEVEIQLEVPEALRVQQRPTTTQRLLQNLIDNALRHGGRKVRIEGRREGPMLVFIVSDDGPGVPEAQLAELFTPFVRGDQARTSAGTGLGLAIVKRIVEMQGGSVRASVGDRAGLRIEVQLPLA